MKRLHALCEEWELQAPAEHRLAELLRLLAEDPEAPTSVTDPSRAVDVHIADSLSGLPLLRDHLSLDEVVDIGSGAGFPGLPIAVALPVQVDLLEATRRKCAFVERAIGRLALENAEVICRRAEEWGAGEGRCRYDAVLVRAVGSLPTLLEYGAPLLREGGVLIAWKGRRDRAEEEAGERAAETLGLRAQSVVKPDPFPGGAARHLYAYEKVAPTPSGYPRRPGIARKRPLGR